MNQQPTELDSNEHPYARPRPDTWAASPIGVDQASVSRHQATLVLTLAERAEHAAHRLKLPKDLRDFLYISVMQRFHHESALNHQSYSQRLNSAAEGFPLELLSAYDHSARGDALPGELIDVRSALGMPSVELAKLSHPCEVTNQELGKMNRAVRSAVEVHGGEFLEDAPKLTAISCDATFFDQDNANYIIMNRSKNIARLPDGTLVRERSQFIVRIGGLHELSLDASNSLRRLIRSTGLKTDGWQQLVVDIDGLNDALERAYNESNYGVVIPMSTTVFAVNAETRKAVEENQRHIRRRRSIIGHHVSADMVVIIRGADVAVPGESATLGPDA